ncbi:MAG: Omp28-related outer membrane protein [Bacteroidetes bacterium]|nr:Omp28-related outer membrane protein [Bacteroidota bacterium]
MNTIYPKSLITAPSLLLLVLILALSSPALDAQSVARVALVEQVTSASCGPCASQNPAFRTLLNANTDNLAIIKYQRGGGGYLDPMWAFNPTQVDSRIGGFYGVYSFPQVWINGEYYGTPGTINQSKIDDELSEPAWWSLDISQELNETQDQLSVSVSFEALRDFQESSDNFLRAHVVVIEEEVNYTSPPGYNSERDFYWVMRNMLTGSSGSILGKQFEGDITTLDYTYDIDLSEIDPTRLKVVAFVQSMTTKEVHQAGLYREAAPSGLDQSSALGSLELSPTLVDRTLSLAFSLEQPETLALQVYDLNGRLVETLNNAWYTAGTHQQTYVLGDYAPGVYFAVIRSSNDSRTERFVVARD